MIAPIDLQPLAMAAAFFQRMSGVAAAYAFGSVPEGRSHRESDLDLAVLLDWAHYPDRASRAERQLELLSDLLRTLGTNRVDLVVLNDTPPLLTRRTTRGTLLYARLHVDDRRRLCSRALPDPRGRAAHSAADLISA